MDMNYPKEFEEHIHTTTASNKKQHITSKGWILEDMLKQGKRFEPVPRISALASLEEINKRISDYEDRGIPLIIEGWHEHPKWPKDLFSVDWLLKHGEQTVIARNCLNWTDKEMMLPDFIDKCRASSPYVEEGDDERYYGKDAYCPKEWEEWIENGPLPPSLLPRGPNNLLQYLPKSHYVETLMCYLGIGDTFTPAHKDLCASSGHNLMCYTENSGSSFWFMTKSCDAPDAAKYFQTNLGHELDHESYVAKTKDFAGAPFTVYLAEQKLGDLVLVPKRSCHQVVNNGGLTIKSSWSRMTIDGLSTAFYHELPIYRRVCRVETYRVRALCYHSILHYRNEVEDLQRLASSPQEKKCETDITDVNIFTQKEHKVKRDLSSLNSSPLTELSDDIEDDKDNVMDVSEGIICPKPSKIKNLADIEARLQAIALCLKNLIALFDSILKEEYDDAMVSSQLPGTMSSASNSSTSLSTAIGSSFTCDFCGADIFQSFFECKDCAGSDAIDNSDKESDEAVIICPGCYVEGRTCACSKMHPRLSVSFKSLIDDRNRILDFLESRFTKVWRPFKLSEQMLKNYRSIDHPPVFQSACIIWQRRKLQLQQISAGKVSMRQCAHPKVSHAMPRLSTLNCLKCHSGKCYIHLLELGIHSCEAIFMHEKDTEKGKSWHEFHMKQRQNFKQRKSEAEEAEKNGSAINTLATTGWAAMKYKICLPVNAKKTRGGWYDSSFGTDPSGVNTNETDEIALISEKKSNDLSSDGGRTPKLTIRLPARPVTNVQTNVIHRAYIDVPPAPYDTPGSRLKKRARIEESASNSSFTPTAAPRSSESYFMGQRVGYPNFNKNKSVPSHSPQTSMANCSTDVKTNAKETSIMGVPKRSTGQAVLDPLHEPMLIDQMSCTPSSPQLEIRRSPNRANEVHPTLNATNFAGLLSNEAKFRDIMHNLISEEIDSIRNYSQQPIHLVDRFFLKQKKEVYRRMKITLQGSFSKLESEIDYISKDKAKTRKDIANISDIDEIGPSQDRFSTPTRKKCCDDLHNGDCNGEFRKNNSGHLNHDDYRRGNSKNYHQRRYDNSEYRDRSACKQFDLEKSYLHQQTHDRRHPYDGWRDRDGGAEHNVNRQSNTAEISYTATMEDSDQTPGRSKGIIPYHRSPSLKVHRNPNQIVEKNASNAVVIIGNA